MYLHLSQQSYLLLKIYSTGTLVPYKIGYMNCHIVCNSKKLETSVDVVGTNTQITKRYVAIKKNKKASSKLKCKKTLFQNHAIICVK